MIPVLPVLETEVRPQAAQIDRSGNRSEAGVWLEPPPID